MIDWEQRIEEERRQNEESRAFAAADWERRRQEKAERDAALQATKLELPGQTRDRLARWSTVATMILDGLRGKPFVWRGVDAQHYGPIARAMGITLITKSRAEKLGFVLKPKASTPVGQMYFRAPISKYADVYVLECQFTRVAPLEPQKVLS